MKKTILIQLDPDQIPSVFDRVVAVDAGAEVLFSHGGITPENVTSLIHGAIFTRGIPDLKSTAIFIGGSDVYRAEDLLAAVKKTFFGPMRVSVMLDPNGSNTTAAAAVLAASTAMSLSGAKALVMGGSGPVGLRVCELLAREGAEINLSSRDFTRAQAAASRLSQKLPDATIKPFSTSSQGCSEMFHHVDLVVAAGSAGVQMISRQEWENPGELKAAVDLNAVPPLGIEGIEVTDNGRLINGVACFGALGVGGLKMKIHKAAIKALFEANDRILDTHEIYELGRSLLSSSEKRT